MASLMPITWILGDYSDAGERSLSIAPANRNC